MGTLDEVSRAVGAIEAQTSNLAEQHRLTHQQIKEVAEALRPLPELMQDYMLTKAKVEKHDTLLQRTIGVFAAVAIVAGFLGNVLHTMISAALSKVGFN